MTRTSMQTVHSHAWRFFVMSLWTSTSTTTTTTHHDTITGKTTRVVSFPALHHRCTATFVWHIYLHKLRWLPSLGELNKAHVTFRCHSPLDEFIMMIKTKQYLDCEPCNTKLLRIWRYQSIRILMFLIVIKIDRYINRQKDRQTPEIQIGLLIMPQTTTNNIYFLSFLLIFKSVTCILFLDVCYSQGCRLKSL